MRDRSLFISRFKGSPGPGGSRASFVCESGNSGKMCNSRAGLAAFEIHYWQSRGAADTVSAGPRRAGATMLCLLLEKNNRG